MSHLLQKGIWVPETSIKRADGTFISGAVVDTASTQTLTNKTLTGATINAPALLNMFDNATAIYDNLDNTKSGQFQLSTVTTGQNRVVSWPDKNGTMAVTADIVAPDTISAVDYGYKAWTFDPIIGFAGAGNDALGGYLFLTAIPIRANTTVSNIVMQVMTAGATLTSGQCFAGLYSSAGNLLATTASQSTAWASTGFKTMALTGAPVSVSAGVVWVGLFSNGTTLPKFLAAVSTAGGIDVSPSTFKRSAYGSTGNTTVMPSTWGTVNNHGYVFWAALS